MKMRDLSPRAEPVTWALAIGLLIAALGSTGFNLTEEWSQFFLVVGPVAVTGFLARWAVYAPDTVKKIRDRAHKTHPSDPAPPLPSPPGGGDLPTPAEPVIETPAFNPQDEDTWPSDPTKHSL